MDDQNTEVAQENQPSAQDLAFQAYDESMAAYDENSQASESSETPESLKVRDEQGRFAKNEQKPDELIALVNQEQPLTPEFNLEDKPPSSLSAGLKSKWSALPPDVRAEFVKRHEDAVKGYEKIRPDVEYGKNMREYLTPYEPLFQEMGGAGQAIGDMLYTAKVLRYGTASEKQNAMVEIAKKFNIQLPSQGAEPVQPNEEIRALNERLLAFETKEKERELKVQEEQKNSYTKAAEKWMTEKDKEGKPLRPYVDSVMNEMAVWIPHLRKESPELTPDQVFQEAYDRAVWAHPETKALLLAEQQASSQEAHLRRSKAKDAIRSASNNVNKKGTLSGKPEKGSLRELAEAAYDETMDNYGG